MRDLKISASRDAKTTHAHAKAYADNTNRWQLDLLYISHAATQIKAEVQIATVQVQGHKIAIDVIFLSCVQQHTCGQ